MSKLISINSTEDILPEYKDTPIGLLLEYHNLQRSFNEYTQAELLIGMCMDNRKSITMPSNFAYVIRDGGANIRYSEFKVSYAIGVGGIKHIAIIGHNKCGMVNIDERKVLFINGLVETAGCERQWAEEHYQKHSSTYEIGNEIDFTKSEVNRLRKEYPNVMIAPMLYNVDDNRLYLISEQ